MTTRKRRAMSGRPAHWVAGALAVASVSCAAPPSSDPDPNFILLHRFVQGQSLPVPEFALADAGSDAPIDYAAFGRFEGVGTADYRYVIDDPVWLRRAVGEGVFPNETGVLADPAYEPLAAAGRLGGSHWQVLNGPDRQSALFVWALAREDPGVKAFFTGLVLERAGHILPALKAYHAAFVHFPRSASWGPNGDFVWYIAPAALANIHRLCRDYPALAIRLVDARITIQNGQDTNLENDVVTVWPGRFVPEPAQARAAGLIDPRTLTVQGTRGTGAVRLIKLSNGQWQLQVHGRPFFVRGITYGPTLIGVGPKTNLQFGSQWMFLDQNANRRIDAPEEAWVDANGNGVQDPDERAIGDFQLLKEMGVNAIRLYVGRTPDGAYDPSSVNKPLLRRLYRRYGIRVIVGDFFGAYTVGSGATWLAGTDYTDADQRRRMQEGVRRMVRDLKHEPFVLLWLLGNENNMPADYTGINATRTNAFSQPEAYARLLNDAAVMIHQMDPNHPVAVGNLDLVLLKEYAQFAPALDIVGINAYRGGQGFGGLWEDAKGLFDRPILITEYGCDAYFEGRGEDEEGQRDYHAAAVRDIVFNQAGGSFAGNAIGGVIFEYLDEWWKDTHSGDAADSHQTKAQYPFPFPDGQSHEEWFGIAGQGSGRYSPFERRLRKAYLFYQDMWAASH